MQTVPLLKICAVNAKEGINGYPFSLALLNRAMEQSKMDICALLFLHLRDELPPNITQNARFTALECLDIGSLDDLRQALDEQNLSPCNSLVFIDSLSVLIEQFSLPSTSWFLTQIAELSACVLALSHNVEEEDWRRIESIASTVFELEAARGNGTNPNPNQEVTLCKTTTKKKNGTLDVKNFLKVEQYSIGDDYTVVLQPFVEPTSSALDPLSSLLASSLALGPSTSSAEFEKVQNGVGKPVEKPESGLANLPFDIGLNLNAEERRAKAGVQLPYMAAQTQKGLVGLRAGGKKCLRAGGQILYTPDEADDFDESDPDDDLTI